MGSPFSWQTVKTISAICWVSFWDLNGPIITALEQINGDLAASAPLTMGDGKGVTRCTKTLWRRWQVQPLRQKSVFLQKVWLWQEAVCKMAEFPFYMRHNDCITCSKSCIPLLYGSMWMYFLLSARKSGLYNIKTQWQVVDKHGLFYFSAWKNEKTYCYTPCYKRRYNSFCWASIQWLLDHLLKIYLLQNSFTITLNIS